MDVNSQEFPPPKQVPFRYHLLRISPPVFTGNLVILWCLGELFLQEVILRKHFTCCFVFQNVFKHRMCVWGLVFCVVFLCLVLWVVWWGFLFAWLFVCLGFGWFFFFCVISLLFSFFSFSLAATVSLEPTVCEFLFFKPLSLQLRWLWRVKLEELCKSFK